MLVGCKLCHTTLILPERLVRNRLKVYCGACIGEEKHREWLRENRSSLNWDGWTQSTNYHNQVLSRLGQDYNSEYNRRKRNGMDKRNRIPLPAATKAQ